MGLFDFLKPKETAAKYLKSGISKHNTQDYDGALKDFIKVTELDVNCVEAYFYLALVYNTLKDYEKSMENSKRLFELDPLFISKLEAKEKQSQPDGDTQTPIVLGWIQTAKSIYHDDGNTGLQLDTLYTDDRLSVFLNTETSKSANAIVDTIVNLNGGISNFEKGIRNGYELFYVGNKFSISWRYSLVGLIQVDMISRESNLFVEFDDTNVEFDDNHNNKAKGEQLNMEAYMAISNGNYLEGIDSVKIALEIMPNNSHFLDTLAVGYYYSGDYELAIETSNKCIAIDNNENSQNSEHYTNRAKINLKLNNDENAIEDLKKALEINPNYQEAIQLMDALK